TVYLLAKELAYDLVTGQTDNLDAALAKTSGKDFVQFANAVEISHSGIGKEICKTKSVGTKSGGAAQYAVYHDETMTKTNSEGRTSLCGDKGHNGSSSITDKHADEAQVLKEFVEKTLLGNESKNWPTSSGVGKKDNDNAKAVAKDLVNLNRDEKTIVAGLLAKTIEGGEVVEMCLSPST
ncbi:putative p44-44 outer membrane protein, silent, partial [Anaplasma phagocytophilum str. CRT53-1]